MLGAETVELLQSGCSLIVATVDADGAPIATRGWGLEVLDTGDGAAARVRLLLELADDEALGPLRAGAPIAVTGADVKTLRAIQLKGRAVGIDRAGAEDHVWFERFCDEFFTAVVLLDRTSRELLERMRPNDITICVIEVDEAFDQTPGPGAGARAGGEP